MSEQLFMFAIAGAFCFAAAAIPGQQVAPQSSKEVRIGQFQYEPSGKSCAVMRPSGDAEVDGGLCDVLKECAVKHPYAPQQVYDCLNETVGAKVMQKN
jgi:hypothetical protein